MATKPNPGPNEEPKSRRFKPVYTSVAPGGALSRDPEGATHYPSGRLLLNVGGTDYWKSLCEAEGLESAKAAGSYQADDVNMVVAVRPVKSTTEMVGLTPVRWVNKDTSVVLHLGGVYKEHPSMRPIGKQQVTVTIEPDDDGNNCLMIALQTALAKRTRTRKSKSNSASAANPPASNSPAPNPSASNSAAVNPTAANSPASASPASNPTAANPPAENSK
ncbi:MAG TPA: hypothetical protein VGK74_15020 [Symbiobacteriaceae bacterium]|jgi:hypothetical protein